METRLESIKSKLDKLKSIDRNFTIFGSSKHKYVSQKVSVEEVENFEEKYNFTLPSEYREFIINIGIGAGPKYGLLSLQEIEKYITSAAEYYEQVINPAMDFEISIDDMKNYFSSCRNTREEIIHEDLSGLIPICFEGCTYYSCIITAGEQMGYIWAMDEGKPARIVPAYNTSNIGFYDWYENWLDLSLRPGVIVNDPSVIPPDLLKVTALNYENLKVNILPEHVFMCQNLSILKLRGNCLTRVLPSILELQMLEELDLSDNKLGHIPSVLGGLKSLKRLSLRGNSIEDWNDNSSLLSRLTRIIRKQNSIFDLKELEFLNLSSNKLEHISDDIASFKKLKRLWITFNSIMHISEYIGELKDLEDLSMAENKIKRIPSSIGNITKLRSLNFENNQIEEIPQSIGNLKKLEILNLNYNRIKKLPDEIGQLESLVELNLIGKSTAFEIPKSMSNLKNLKKVSISKDIHTGIEVLTNLPNVMVIAI